MDDIVRQAQIKWPQVPACFGWLGLDARGRWYLRDDACQAAGPFPQSRGSLLEHEKLIEFIGRNYEADTEGRWFFQNGPQRVYVELESTPWIWRVSADAEVTSHTGHLAKFQGALLDAQGRLYLHTDLGVGLVHTLDMGRAADIVEQGRWNPTPVEASDLPARFAFVRSPAARESAPAASPAR